MSPAKLGPAHSRRLAIGVLFAGILVVVAVVAVPVWLLNRHYDLALAENSDRVERYTRIAGTRAEIGKQLEAMRAKDPRKFFLRAGGPALSAAEAQEVIRALVESSGGRLITMQAPTYKDEGRYRQISVNVQLTANIVALRRIVHAIENNTPYLFVDSLSVRSQVPSTFRPQAGQEPEMFVQLEVSGYSPGGTS